MTEEFKKILCPRCGRMLGCYEGTTAVIRKKGRVIRIVTWQDAYITCEDCGTSLSVEPQSAESAWNGVFKSIKPTENIK